MSEESHITWAIVVGVLGFFLIMSWSEKNDLPLKIEQEKTKQLQIQLEFQQSGNSK